MQCFTHEGESAMAKDGRPKLPKRIAGLKVPKEVRRSPVALWLYNSDFVRELIVSALIAGSAALVKDETVGRKASGAKKKAARTSRRAVGAVLGKSSRAKPSKRGRRGGRVLTISR
jgi:hypothetical protein